MMVFLHIPKTAGSSFNFVLENSFGIRACHTNHTKKRIFDQRDLAMTRRLFPGLRSISGHNLMDPMRLTIPDAFFMTFVREPVATVISRYQDSVRLGGNKRTFEQCLREDPTYQNIQVKFMAGEPDLERAKEFLRRCGFVGVAEKFDLSLLVITRLSPYKINPRYTRRRVTPATHSLKKELESDQRLMELARTQNQLDLQLYQFATEEIFPKLCEKAGVSMNQEVERFDRYQSERQPKFLLFNLYNMLFYRQLCKILCRDTALKDGAGAEIYNLHQGPGRS
jgi:hypothetical protein